MNKLFILIIWIIIYDTQFGIIIYKWTIFNIS